MKKQHDLLVRPFTLVEIMTVLCVILALIAGATFIGPVITKMSNDAKTKALIRSICLALEEYKNSELNGGNYPVSRPRGRFTNLTNTAEISYQPFYLDNFDFTRNDGSAVDPRRNMIQYFDLDSLREFLQFDSAANSNYLKDAFGMPLIYHCPGRLNTGTFDLISTGANALPGDGIDTKGNTLNTFFSTSKQTDDTGQSVDDRPEYIKPNADYAQYLGKGDDLTN